MKYAFLAGLVSCAAAHGSLVNVAFDKPVSLVAGATSGQPLPTLVDGVFRPRGTLWTSGTVYWSGLTTTIQIDLQSEFRIVGAIVQGDDNDAYRMWYRNMDTGDFELLWDVPNMDGFGNGMQTRPNPASDTEVFMFATPRVTDAVRIAAISGDNSYSLSEIQVFVPSPAGCLPLALTGLLLRRCRG